MATILPSQFRANINDNDAVSYAGRSFSVDGEKAWSFTSTDNNTLRFEIRKGDQFSDSVWTDPIGTERTEMGDMARYAINQLVTVEYKFMIEPGAKFTMRWMTLGQLHSALSVTPPLEICFNGNDRMKITGKSGSSSSIVYKDLFVDSADIVRGKWYSMKLAVFLSSKNYGAALIHRDGVKIVDYSGPLGYNDQTHTYWKQGVYRSTAPETVVVNYKDLKLAIGAVVPDVVVPPPVVVAPPPPPPPVVVAPPPPVFPGPTSLEDINVWAQTVEARLKALEAK